MEYLIRNFDGRNSVMRICTVSSSEVRLCVKETADNVCVWVSRMRDGGWKQFVCVGECDAGWRLDELVSYLRTSCKFGSQLVKLCRNSEYSCKRFLNY